MQEFRLDNITHSLIGVAAGELAQPSMATPAERRLFLAGNILAANLPDIDVLYTRITEPPLGYLLHHRGYTHTVAGILGLGLLMAFVLALSPTARRLAATNRVRLWAPLALNLIGHVWLDSFNTYGVHPFYPFDASWFYGDAVFIFEPWLWVLLGIAAIANARGRVPRLLTAALVTALFVAIVALGVVPPFTVAMLVITAAALAAVAKFVTPRMRSAVALGAAAVCLVGMSGLSRVARAETLAAIEADRRGEVVDVVLSPDPAVPVCWTAIVTRARHCRGTTGSTAGHPVALADVTSTRQLRVTPIHRGRSRPTIERTDRVERGNSPAARPAPRFERSQLPGECVAAIWPRASHSRRANSRSAVRDRTPRELHRHGRRPGSIGRVSRVHHAVGVAARRCAWRSESLITITDH